MIIIVQNITSQVVVSGKDNIVCNIFKELREYLRVRPHNYGQMLMQMRRRGIKGWDGYTYFINEKGIFPTGFLGLVYKFSTDLGITVTFEDRRVNMPAIVFESDYDFSTPSFTLDTHQQQLLIATFQSTISNLVFARGIWDAATNAGKTATAACLLKNVENSCGLMLFDRAGLLKQTYAVFKSMFPKSGDVGIITSNKLEFGRKCTLVMVRTMYNRIKKSPTIQRDLNSKINVLILEECHKHTSRVSAYVINKINAGIRIGMSGTPLKMSDKVAKFRLIGMTGEILHTVSKAELMHKGVSLTPNIFIYLNPTLPYGLDYDQEVHAVITGSEERAILIADIICKYRKKKILITFYEHNHGELMYNTFCTRYPSLAHLADWVHGNHADRDSKIERYINNDIRILFGSTILKEGYNIPDIEVGIHAQAGKSGVDVSQWTGRLERRDGVNTHFVWIDFWDKGKNCSKHSRKRISFYKNEGYTEPITFMYENKRGVPI
jgi:superfamily II DNA or RNA helicase